MALDPFSVALAGWSLYSAYSGEEQQKDQLGKMKAQERESLVLQQKLLAEQEQWLKTVSGQRQKMATDIYGRDVRTLVDKMNLSGGNLKRSYEENTGRTGFAYSGTLADRYSRAREEEEMSYAHGRQTLYDQYKTSLMTMQQQEQLTGLRLEQLAMPKFGRYSSDAKPSDALKYMGA